LTRPNRSTSRPRAAAAAPYPVAGPPRRRRRRSCSSAPARRPVTLPTPEAATRPASLPNLGRRRCLACSSRRQPTLVTPGDASHAELAYPRAAAGHAQPPEFSRSSLALSDPPTALIDLRLVHPAPERLPVQSRAPPQGRAIRSLNNPVEPDRLLPALRLMLSLSPRPLLSGRLRRPSSGCQRKRANSSCRASPC
jgi:hypothetical protein